MGLTYTARHLVPPMLVVVASGLIFAITLWTLPQRNSSSDDSTVAGPPPQAQATAMAQLLGANAIPLFAANDHARLEQLLLASKNLPGLKAIYVLNERDLVVAATDPLSDNAENNTVPETYRFNDSVNYLERIAQHTDHDLIVSEPLMLHREFLGRLHIVFAAQPATPASTQPASGHWLWWVVVAALVALAGYLIRYARSLRHEHRRVQNAVQAMVQVAEEGGDLDTRLDDEGNDELATLGYAFNVFYAKMKGVITLIMATSESLATEGENMATHSAETRDRVLQQQANLAEVVTTISAINTTMDSVANNAGAAVNSANEASQQATEGSAVLAGTIESINTLASQVNGASETISALAQAIQNIESVLSVIDNISEQTNLLALNAAIEAARAGDSGRGFAVVAEEVRNLSLQIQAETEGISKSINALQNDAGRAVAEMQQGSEQARTTVEQADAANSALEAIMTAIATIRQMNHDIADSVETQSQQTAQLQTNISSVNQIAEETAAAATQNSQVSHELSLMAGQLKGLIQNVMLNANLENNETAVDESDPELF